MATCRALDRLDRPELSSAEVAEALRRWQQIAAMPAGRLATPHNDFTEFDGPMTRADLERALAALTRRQARELRHLVEAADETFRAKTSNNPRADHRQPWWARRWWH